MLRNTGHTQGQAHDSQQNGGEIAVNHCSLKLFFLDSAISKITPAQLGRLDL